MHFLWHKLTVVSKIKLDIGLPFNDLVCYVLRWIKLNSYFHTLKLFLVYIKIIIHLYHRYFCILMWNEYWETQIYLPWPLPSIKCMSTMIAFDLRYKYGDRNVTLKINITTAFDLGYQHYDCLWPWAWALRLILP